MEELCDTVRVHPDSESDIADSCNRSVLSITEIDGNNSKLQKYEACLNKVSF